MSLTLIVRFLLFSRFKRFNSLLSCLNSGLISPEGKDFILRLNKNFILVVFEIRIVDVRDPHGLPNALDNVLHYKRVVSRSLSLDYLQLDDFVLLKIAGNVEKEDLNLLSKCLVDKQLCIHLDVVKPRFNALNCHERTI